MSTQAQKEQVLKHLMQGKKLTPLDALKKFDSIRLAARISELRKEGHLIHSKLITVPSGKRVAQYSLIKTKA